MKRYFKAFGYLLSVHVLALLVMTLFRLVEFIALHGMIVDAEASRVMAFVKGVWFDNVCSSSPKWTQKMIINYLYF